MKPHMLALLKGKQVAKEDLVEGAIDANATANTTDPAQAQQNVDFAAEIKRLKKLKDGEDGSSDGGDGGTGGDGGDGGDGGSDTPPADPPAEGGDGGESNDPAEPKEGDDTEPKEGKDDGEGDPDSKEDDGETDDLDTSETGDDDPEEASESKPTEDAEAAVEALAFASRACELIHQAHDTGVIKPYHAKLVMEGISNFGKRHGVSMTGFATEGDMPDSSMGKVKYIGGKIAEFVRAIMAKLREYFTKIMAWIKEVIRHYNERRGIFEKNQAGLLARMKFLQGKAVDETQLNAAIEKTTLKLRALSYGENDLKSVQEGARLLSLVSVSVKAIVESGNQTQLINAMVAAGAGDETSLRQSDTVITATELLKIDKSTDIFGHEKALHDNFTADNKSGKMVFCSLNNLIGGVSYQWTLAQNAAVDLDEAVNVMVGYNFNSTMETGAVDFKPLRSVEECMEVLNIAIKLNASIAANSKSVAFLQELAAKASEISPVLLKQLEDAGLGEHLTTKCASILGASPQALVRLFVNMTVQHGKHLDNVAQQLQQWIAESLNVINSALVEKNKG